MTLHIPPVGDITSTVFIHPILVHSPLISVCTSAVGIVKVMTLYNIECLAHLIDIIIFI